MSLGSITNVRIGGQDHNLLMDAGVVATAGVAGGAAAAMPLLYRAHSGANAPMAQLARTAAKPAIIGGVIGATAALGLVAFGEDYVDNALKGAGMGAAMGGLMFLGNNLSAIGTPINGRVPSAFRVLAGPVLLGAGIGSAIGLVGGAGFGITGAQDAKEAAARDAAAK